MRNARPARLTGALLMACSLVGILAVCALGQSIDITDPTTTSVEWLDATTCDDGVDVSFEWKGFPVSPKIEAIEIGGVRDTNFNIITSALGTEGQMTLEFSESLCGLDPGLYDVTVEMSYRLTNSGPTYLVTETERDAVGIEGLEADLEIDKRVDDATPEEGDTVVFTIELENNGPDDAHNVRVRDRLPDGLTYVRYSATQGSYNPSTGVWSGIDYVPGPHGMSDLYVALTIHATVDEGTAGETIVNTASISAADEDDPVYGNNSDAATIRVEERPLSCQLTVEKSVDNPTPYEGDLVVFTIVPRNGGPDDATGVVVDDRLPHGLSYVSHLASRGSYSPSLGSWAIGDLPVHDPGIAPRLTITARVDEGTAGRTIINVAEIHGNEPDPIGDNRDTARVTVQGETPGVADVAVLKGASNPTPSEGELILFIIELENLGPDDATGVHLLDLLPEGLTYVEHLATRGIYDPETGLWTEVDVPGPQGTADIYVALQIHATVDEGTAGQTLVNVATIIGADQSDPEPDNNVGVAEIVVAGGEDCDGDGIPDPEDPCPCDPDCDDDGLPDPEDPCPTDPDCDDDGLPDPEDPCPLDPDCDDDGLPDPEDPCPLDPDCDDDGLPDPDDPCPTDPDCDDDWIPDPEDPCPTDPDCDDDGIPDP
ncbi:MAG: DUF11 domain-containing protein, partial [Candidatus Bipolaricaulota bacterium]